MSEERDANLRQAARNLLALMTGRAQDPATERAMVRLAAAILDAHPESPEDGYAGITNFPTPGDNEPYDPDTDWVVAATRGYRQGRSDAIQEHWDQVAADDLATLTDEERNAIAQGETAWSYHGYGAKPESDTRGLLTVEALAAALREELVEGIEPEELARAVFAAIPA